MRSSEVRVNAFCTADKIRNHKKIVDEGVIEELFIIFT
jgi:hypothetical protein